MKAKAKYAPNGRGTIASGLKTNVGSLIQVVHKQIHRVLDDCLFEMFDEIGYEIDNSNIDTLDLIIDEIMKVAVARY